MKRPTTMKAAAVKRWCKEVRFEMQVDRFVDSHIRRARRGMRIS